ncbi:N4-gp56 family major capsid protein [Dysosmobacter sp.]|uniref:N4-gp56 family major capsid protein n=1 Tax=Dysosmobacter sp. TaxID=2591382 RepID=UPI002A95DB84|nr:N4-gp56 family major capsid protein [Dysosmobacter sp.]MDY5509523.1 N4-gp56 family major capsid protein [Dysosmobacter sp.]
MAGGQNLASKYAPEVDERFYRNSQAVLALNNNYKFTGVQTVNVYSIPVVPMTDYKRTGSNRYGTPNDLTRNVQTLKVNRDRGYTFIIDKGDKIQSQMVMDAGKALSRQIREVWVPEYDTYVFQTLSAKATEMGNFDTTEVSKSNAYELFLAGQEALGNANVPDDGRVAFCSYRFANFLKQDPAFMKYGNESQEMVIKGVIGEVDGCKIVKVPSGRLPNGCAFILTHPIAATAPKQLEEYKIHDNPPGISGWLVEGRVIYDCFVLNEKANAIYYHGSQPVSKNLTVMTSGSNPSKSTVIVIPGAPESGNSWKYETAEAVSGLTAAEYGAAWASTGTALAGSGAEITPDSGDTVIQVVELDSASKVVARGVAPLNIG